MFVCFDQLRPTSRMIDRASQLSRTNRTVKCQICDITLNSELQAKQHYNGKTHLRKIRKINRQSSAASPGEEVETDDGIMPQRTEEDTENERGRIAAPRIVGEAGNVTVSTKTGSGVRSNQTRRQRSGLYLY